MKDILQMIVITGLCGAMALGCAAEDDGTDVSADIGVSVSDSTDDALRTNDTTVIINDNNDTTVVRDTTVVSRTDTVVKEVPAKPNNPNDPMNITTEERIQIDQWLKANADSLNQYGDRIDMMYTGGTPLFNESTGERIDRYVYIVRNHPDKPWRMGKQ